MKSNLSIIGVHGKAGSGKDTIGAYLSDKYGYKVFKFASPMKKAIGCMSGVDMDFIEYGLKDKPASSLDMFWCNENLFMRFDEKVNDYPPEAKRILSSVSWEKFPSTRAMAQELGGNYRNVLFEDIWVALLAREVFFLIVNHTPTAKNPCRIVITDVRYENEANWIRSLGGKIWHVLGRENRNVRKHESEAGIEIGLKDPIFVNDGTIEDLKKMIDTMFR